MDLIIKKDYVRKEKRNKEIKLFVVYRLVRNYKGKGN